MRKVALSRLFLQRVLHILPAHSHAAICSDNIWKSCDLRRRETFLSSPLNDGVAVWLATLFGDLAFSNFNLHIAAD